MTGEALRNAIQALLESHPAISVSPSGHATHALRYVEKCGTPLALEPGRKIIQNIWARADSLDVSRLADIKQKFYDHLTFDVSKPNHNLFGEAAFKDADLICFQVENLWEAVRVIPEVAGLGEPT